MLLGSRSSTAQGREIKVNESMMIDEGAYSVLAAARGAYLCRSPPIPNEWDSCRRPHVAVLCSEAGRVEKFYLSYPICHNKSNNSRLIVEDLDNLYEGSIIEVKENNLKYSYFRNDNNFWLKVAESSNPFFVEVFSHGSVPIRIRLANGCDVRLGKTFS